MIWHFLVLEIHNLARGISLFSVSFRVFRESGNEALQSTKFFFFLLIDGL